MACMQACMVRIPQMCLWHLLLSLASTYTSSSGSRPHTKENSSILKLNLTQVCLSVKKEKEKKSLNFIYFKNIMYRNIDIDLPCFSPRISLQRCQQLHLQGLCLFVDISKNRHNCVQSCSLKKGQNMFGFWGLINIFDGHFSVS